jgi:hypothetical protein
VTIAHSWVPAYRKHIIPVEPETWESLVLQAAGRINAGPLANVPRGMLFLGGAAYHTVTFVERKDIPWNCFPVVRDGFLNYEEVTDAAGNPPCPYFDFDTIR